MYSSIVIFTLGLIVGSFLNVVIHRLPRRISIISPPSFCPACHKRVNAWQNIPVLSYILLKGKCYYCSTKIPFRYPLIELFNGFFYLLILYKFGISLNAMLYMMLISTLIIISFIDIDYQIIPDIITLPGIVIGFIAGAFLLFDPLLIKNCEMNISSFGLPVLYCGESLPNLGLMGSMIGLVTGGGLLYLIAVISKGGMGGGDIKMMTMVGAALGWKSVFMTIFMGSLTGSIYGIALIIAKGKGRKTKIPFGPFLSIGAIVTILYGKEILYLYLKGF